MKISPVSTTIIAIALAAMFSVASPGQAQRPERYVMCEGKYALCDLATCSPISKQGDDQAGSKSVQPTHAICTCDVKQGQNMGPGPCENRVGPEPGQLLSTYSLANSKAKDGSWKKYQLCEPGGSETPTSHTTCYGYPCREMGNGQAECTCPIFYDQAFVTLKGDCADPSACTQGLLQGGTPTDSVALNYVFGWAIDQPSAMEFCSEGGS